MLTLNFVCFTVLKARFADQTTFQDYTNATFGRI